MRKLATFIVWLVTILGTQAAIQPQKLKCEYIINPLGIDNSNPRLSWELVSDKRGDRQTAYEIVISSDNKFSNEHNCWSTGLVPSSQSINIEYSGIPIKPFTRYYWKIKAWDKDNKESNWSDIAWFETSMLKPSDWKACWIWNGLPLPNKDEDFYNYIPNPLFRRAMKLDKQIAQARFYISGLGYYESFINGKKIGNNVLDPGWTSYDRRVLYSTYDVTSMLQKGNNTIAVMLGNGWYNPLPLKLFGSFNLRDALDTGEPKFIAQLTVKYTDGTEEIIVSDKQWKTSEGPILKNSVFLGETYDARLEQVGWTGTTFNDINWKFAITAEPPAGIITAQMQPAIEITRILKPIAFTEPKLGVYIFDMGQNFAGVAKLRVMGNAGTKICLKYGESLHADGSLNYFTTVAGHIKEIWALDGGPGCPKTAWQQDEYILKGNGEEIYVPHFTFHGFRYVEVTGFPGKPDINSIEGMRMNCALDTTGIFACSNSMFNKIQEMTLWTFLSNLFSVESDCPGREKQGYGADMVTASEALIYNYNMAQFYAKSVRDFSDNARPNGGLPECAPYNGIASEGFGGGTGSTGWTLAHPFLITQLYKYYGDKRLMQEQYPVVKRLVDFIHSKVPNHIVDRCIGDHESFDPKAIELSATAFYYHHVTCLVEMASLLGQTEDKEKYTLLADDIKAAYIKRFLKPGTGQFDIGTQSTQAFSLWYNLIPEQEKATATNILVNQIKDKHDGHIATGIFGTKYMFDVLTDINRSDLGFTLINQRSKPGYGHMIELGATTLYESWRDEDTVQSFNHPMFGSVSEYFYRSVLGINIAPDAEGANKIIIKPQPQGDISWAKGHYNSIRGIINSNWKIEGNKFSFHTNVPVNSSATIVIPCKSANSVKENNLVPEPINGLKFIKYENGYAWYEAVSGDYNFTSEI